MIRFAAISDDGQKCKAHNRHAIDRWAAEQAKRGQGVEVYAIHRNAGIGPRTCVDREVELVGVWNPVTWGDA